ncbi:MAG: hypothetical protein C5B43_02465 [Verrucomicrobia bacterium]|nr:MAG: hypothetical protein C5B43_02465 [Verrucomicrobiota bacterium]
MNAGGTTFLVANFPPLGSLPVFRYELPMMTEASLLECFECAIDPQIQKYLESKVGERIASYLKKWMPSAKEYMEGVKSYLPEIGEEFAKHFSKQIGHNLTFQELGVFALESATSISQMYNDYLRLALDDLQRRLKIKIYRLDLNNIFEEIVNHPKKYELEYVDRPALDTKTRELLADVDVNQYLFFDGVHPISKAHKVIGETAAGLFKR